MPTWLQIGLVGKAHGLRGHFFVAQREDPLPVDLGTEVFLESPPKGKPYRLEESKMQGKRPIAKLKGIDRREQVDVLVGTSLWADRDKILYVAENEFFWTDLIGKTILDSDGLEVGTVIEIQNFGASDVVTLENDELGCLDLALVDTYFDMAFNPTDKHIHLVVPAATFAELWRD